MNNLSREINGNKQRMPIQRAYQSLNAFDPAEIGPAIQASCLSPLFEMAICSVSGVRPLKQETRLQEKIMKEHLL
jgi:hypothetical protein